MNVRVNLFLALVSLLGLVAISAHAASLSPDFYVSMQRNVTIEAGQQFTISSLAVNNFVYGPWHKPVVYTYEWYNATSGTPVLMRNYNTTMLALTAGSAGKYTYWVQVTNAIGVSVWNESTVLVSNPPSISIIPNSITLDQDQTYRLTSHYEPGTGNVTYMWYLANLTAVSPCKPGSQTCTISTAGAYPGTYNVSLSIRENSEQSYMSAYTISKIKVNAAPTITAVASENSVTGNVVYSISVLNGTGPFNISLHTTSGANIGNVIVYGPNETTAVFFHKPSSTTSYYVSAVDMGAAVPYFFNSSAVTITVPPSASTTDILALVVVLLLIIVVVLYVRASTYSGAGTRSRNTDSDYWQSDMSSGEGNRVYESGSADEQPYRKTDMISMSNEITNIKKDIDELKTDMKFLVRKMGRKSKEGEDEEE